MSDDRIMALADRLFASGYVAGDVREYASGGKIHIKPSKRGTFTAAAKKHGKSVQAFASQVLAHKENYSPAMVKKANFARNSRRWSHNHASGGYLQDYRHDYELGGVYDLSEDQVQELIRLGYGIEQV